MIPYHFLEKMGNYEVTVHGVKVKVSVVTDVRLIAGKISELMSFMEKRRVMGLDFKVDQYNRDVYQLLLCAGNHCLIIPAIFNDGKPLHYCKELMLLLSDDTICFVGVAMRSKVKLYSRNFFICKAGVELGHLVARVLKKPNLEMCSQVVVLGGEVGLDIKPPTPLGAEASGVGASSSREPSWSGKVVFSEEEVKYAIHDVYASFLIGNKLLGIL
ncbi:hypothetical protein ACFX10_010244 [Malus domestica]